MVVEPPDACQCLRDVQLALLLLADLQSGLLVLNRRRLLLSPNEARTVAIGLPQERPQSYSGFAVTCGLERFAGLSERRYRSEPRPGYLSKAKYTTESRGNYGRKPNNHSCRCWPSTWTWVRWQRYRFRNRLKDLVLVRHRNLGCNSIPIARSKPSKQISYRIDGNVSSITPASRAKLAAVATEAEAQGCTNFRHSERTELCDPPS